MHPQNNQEVFASSVRALLETGGVEFIDQDPGPLIESLKHGEGSVITALNYVVRMHVAWLIAEVCKPFDGEGSGVVLPTMTKVQIQDWTEDALRICNKILCDPRNDGDTRAGGAWQFAMPGIDRAAGSVSREAPPDDPRLWGTLVSDRVAAQLIEERRYGLVASVYADGSEWNCFTIWHRFLISDVIDHLVSSDKALLWYEWGGLVHMSAMFFAESESSDYDREADLNRTAISAPRTSREFWAWQFGRVAALGITIDEIRDVEYFDGWDDGLAALSLMLGSGQPVDWLTQRAWTGASITWPAGRDGAETSDHDMWLDPRDPSLTYPLDIVPDSHLYWLMRVGVLDAIHTMGAIEPSQTDQISGEPSGGDALLLGSHKQLGRSIVDAMGNDADLGDALLLSIEAARQRREEQVTAELKEQLRDVWDQLPEDSVEALIDAQRHMESRDWRDASLDYANSVEAALTMWLRLPEGTRRTNTTLGEWGLYLKDIARQSRDRSRDEKWLRQKYDVSSSTGLAAVLKTLADVRVPRSHLVQRSPLAHKAQGMVLGIETKSVFELILRFARRWRG